MVFDEITSISTVDIESSFTVNVDCIFAFSVDQEGWSRGVDRYVLLLLGIPG
jgi:hypothetical protein